MKRLLFLILLLPCLVYGQTVGIKVASPIIKNNPSDNTVTGYADLLNGGYHIVTSLAGRDSLNTAYSKTLKVNMLCYVGGGVDSTYRWNGSTWIVQGAGNVTLSQLTDSLSNYTPLQDGLISGGSATIGTGSVTIDTAYYRINKVNYMSLPRTFTGIANSASGTQYYILIYGKNDNTLDTLQGVQDTIATIPTKPAGTVSINTVLVGDGGVENTVPDLTGYAKLTGGNSFYGRQTFYDHAIYFNSIYGIPQVFVDMSINGIYRGGFGSFNDRFRISGADDSGLNTFPYVEMFRADKHSKFYGTVEGIDPVNAQDFVTKAYGDTNYSGSGGTVTSITSGTGLTGGTITTSGTIAVDTTSIRTVANSYSLSTGQPKLVSGTNIKTVNSTSLLGSGNLATELPLTFTTPLSRSTNTISIPPATTSASGYLSSTDWNTFNSKQSALGFTPANIDGSNITQSSFRTALGLASSAYLGASQTSTANTVAQRTADGYLYAAYFNVGLQSTDVGIPSQMVGSRDEDGFYRYYSPAQVNNFLGSPSGGETLQSVTDRGSMTTHNLSIGGNTTANSFIKSGGTSSQFLKADGSSDSNTYLTSSTGVSSITGTTNQVIASGSTGAVTLSLPQSIATTSTPQFGGLGIGASSSSTTFFNTSAGTTSKSSFRIPNGVAPTTPVSGDWWSLTTGLRTQTYDGTQTKDVIFDKANSVFAGLGTGMIATNNSGDLSVVPIADRLTTNVITKTANYTVTLSDVGANGEVLVRADATSGNITITLPVASTATGLNFIVKKTDSSVNTVTVSVASTIDGASTKVYSTQYSGGRITSNGTTYSITGGF